MPIAPDPQQEFPPLTAQPVQHPHRTRREAQLVDSFVTPDPYNDLVERPRAGAYDRALYRSRPLQRRVRSHLRPRGSGALSKLCERSIRFLKVKAVRLGVQAIDVAKHSFELPYLVRGNIVPDLKNREMGP
jgi:hypothetical protein